MKLNNKGFAITSIIYGLLIMFVLLVGSYLTVLTAKKNRVDNLMEEIDHEIGFNDCANKTGDTCTDYVSNIISNDYNPPYTGKYVFQINDSYGCVAYLYKNESVNLINNSICDCDSNHTCPSIINKIQLFQIYY